MEELREVLKERKITEKTACLLDKVKLILPVKFKFEIFGEGYTYWSKQYKRTYWTNQSVEQLAGLEDISKVKICIEVSQAALQNWLRKKLNCIVEVTMHTALNKEGNASKVQEMTEPKHIQYLTTIDYYGKDFDYPLGGNDFSDAYKLGFKSYESALEWGLRRALKLIATPSYIRNENDEDSETK